jgi:hypothetical protein
VGRSAPLFLKINRKKGVYAPPAFENFVFFAHQNRKIKVTPPLLLESSFFGHRKKKF